MSFFSPHKIYICTKTTYIPTSGDCLMLSEMDLNLYYIKLTVLYYRVLK